MKKEEIKKLVKSILIWMLIVCFVTSGVFTTIEYINSKVRSDYLFSEKYVDEKYIMYLEDIEDKIAQASETIDEVAGVDPETYPVTGAAIEMLTVLDGIYEMQMLAISALVGLIVGVVHYIMKKDYKKIVHYIALYLAILLVLNMLIALVTMAIDNIGVSALYEMAIGYIDYIDLIETTIIPYTIGYILICIIIYLINKKRTEKFNEYIK